MEESNKKSVLGTVLKVALAGCGCMVVLGAIAAVSLGVVGAKATEQYELKAKRSELPKNVDEIRTKQAFYDAAHDGYVAAGSEAEARASLTPEPRAWKGGGGWDTLAWWPYEMVRGGSWVEVSATGFTVHGVIDADGDGVAAEYVATESTSATLVTSEDVY